MKKITLNNLRLVSPVVVLLGGITFVLALMLFEAFSYPASLSKSGLTNFIASVGALLGYAIVAWWMQQKPTTATQIALAQGTKIGLFLSFVALVDLFLEHFVASDATINIARGIGMWGLMFLSFGIAGSATYRKVYSLGDAIIASVWSGLISAVGMLSGGFLLPLLFMPQMIDILAPASAQSKMTDAQAFVIEHTLNAAAMHLLFVPIVALIFGLMGGGASFLLKSINQRVAISLVILEILLFIGGLAALGLMSSLDRSARPPFVLTGLLALGIALSCAHPIFTTIRDPSAK